MPKNSFNRKTTTLTLIIHTVILIATAVTAITGILYGASSSQDGDNMIGLGYFKAFTMDINIIAGICALFIVCFAIKSLLRKEDAMPAWVSVFQFTTAVDLLLTFLTVVFFLAPMDAIDGKSYWGMFSNDLLLYHLINPLLFVLSFIFLQKHNFKTKDCLWGELPLVVYTVVYFLMVVVFKQWDDFYNFSFGGNYALIPPVIIVMLSLTYYLGRLLIGLNNKSKI